MSGRKRTGGRALVLGIALFTTIPLATSLTGCGGGGTAQIITARGKSQTNINWAARSRAVNGPSSARSMIITYAFGNTSGGGPVAFTHNRRDDPAAYSEVFETPSDVRLVPQNVNIRFFADKDGGGALVGEVTRTVALTTGVTNTGDFTLNGKVNTVEVAAGQSVKVGETKDLGFTAKDANGAAIAVSPGSATFVVTEGGANLQVNANSSVTGTGIGAASVTATVDGKTSAATAVNVVPASVEVAAGQTVKVTETKAVAVVAKDTNGNATPIPAGGVALEIVSGSENVSLADAGQVKGLGIGTAKLKATVSGVASDAAGVDITVEVGPETPTGSGLVIQEQRLGTGVAPVVGKKVRVYYALYLTSNGQLIQKLSPDTPTPQPGQTNPPFEFIQSNTPFLDVIPGFDEGVKTMKVGGQRRLLIPAALAYGNNPPSGIPVNADLTFDIQLVSADQ
jgi:hypothetical protein